MGSTTKNTTKSINAALESITASLLGQVDLEQVLETVINKTMRLLHAERCHLFLEDESSDPRTITMRAGTGIGKRLKNRITYQEGEGLTGHIFKTGETIVAPSLEYLQELTDKSTGQKIWKGKEFKIVWGRRKRKFRNLVGIPLKIGNRVIGVIKVENKLPGAPASFTPQDQTILQTISNVISLAIWNAVLFQKSEDHVQAVASKAARLDRLCKEYSGLVLEIHELLKNHACKRSDLVGALDRLTGVTQIAKALISDFETSMGAVVKRQPRECFVIMPFSDTTSCSREEWTQVFEKMIKPAVEGCGLNYVCTRAGLKAGNIVKDILANLERAEVVVADMTDRNANVFYELGIRHTMRDHTVLITQDIRSIPFDLGHFATVEYRWKTRNPKKAEKEFADSIRKAFLQLDTRSGRDQCTSPVIEYLLGKAGGTMT